MLGSEASWGALQLMPNALGRLGIGREQVLGYFDDVDAGSIAARRRAAEDATTVATVAVHEFATVQMPMILREFIEKARGLTPPHPWGYRRIMLWRVGDWPMGIPGFVFSLYADSEGQVFELDSHLDPKEITEYALVAKISDGWLGAAGRTADGALWFDGSRATEHLTAVLRSRLLELQRPGADAT